MPRRTKADPYASKVGERIQQIYKEQQLTLEVLAARCGIAKGHLSNITRGLSIMTITTLDRIAEGLGVHPSVLLAFPDRGPLDQLIDQVGGLSMEECRDLLRQSEMGKAGGIRE
jgi:transcriptional regulator with XRE-family HTH domain